MCVCVCMSWPAIFHGPPKILCRSMPPVPLSLIHFKYISESSVYQSHDCMEIMHFTPYPYILLYIYLYRYKWLPYMDYMLFSLSNLTLTLPRKNFSILRWFKPASRAALEPGETGYRFWQWGHVEKGLRLTYCVSNFGGLAHRQEEIGKCLCYI